MPIMVNTTKMFFILDRIKFDVDWSRTEVPDPRPVIQYGRVLENLDVSYSGYEPDGNEHWEYLHNSEVLSQQLNKCTYATVLRFWDTHKKSKWVCIKVTRDIWSCVEESYSNSEE